MFSLRRALLNTPSTTGIDTRQLLIDRFDVADRYYVDTTGSDSNDGSSGSPWLTRAHAVSQVAAGKCIIYGAGEFAATNQNQGSLHEVMCGTDYDGVTHIGTPNGTVFTESADNAKRDNQIIGTGDEDTLFAFIHFKRDNEARTDSYKVAILCNQYNVAAKGKAINCVFEELNANGKMSLSYNNNGTSVFELSNCLFIASDWAAPTGSAETGITVKNCAATSVADYGTTATTENNFDNITVDANYHIQESGIKFDGTDDYLEVAAHSDFAFGTNDFTLKATLTFDALSERYLFGPGGRGSTSAWSAGWGVRFDPTRGLCFFKPAGAGGSGSDEAYAAWSPTIGQEYSIEIRRESNVIKMFIDDVEQTVTQSSNSEDIGCTLNFRIGHSANSNGSYDFDGTFKELEVIKNGTQVFHINEVDTDQSASAHTITRSGDVVLVGDNFQGVYSGFYGWKGWGKSGSIKFDGSGDYLRADTALDVFTSTTDVWTIDGIITYNAQGSSNYLLGLNRASNGDNTILFRHNSLYIENTSHVPSPLVPNQTKTYFAVQYDGVNFTVYVGDDRAVNVADTIPVALQSLVFGMGCEFDAANGGTPGNYYDGEIHQLRVSDVVRHSGATITAPEFLDKDVDTEFILWPDPLFNDHSGNNHAITKYGDVRV